MQIGKREEFDLNEMAIFVHVVDAGSFTGAAKNLDLPKSTISRKITQLEERLGVRLIQRTTRSLRLTDTGNAYYGQCARILTEVEEANIAVIRMQSTPTGTLRITAPQLFGSAVLSKLIGGYMEKYPDVNVEMVLTDQVLDLVQEGIDVAFRVGHLDDSSLIGRHLGEARAVLCASTEYAKKYGLSTQPEQLKEHALITLSKWPDWQLFDANNKEFNLHVKPKIQSNDFASIFQLVLNGNGISALPAMLAAAPIEKGRMVPVLSHWSFAASPIHALYPSNRHLSAKVRTFIDYMLAAVRPVPPWEILQDSDKKELPYPYQHSIEAKVS